MVLLAEMPTRRVKPDVVCFGAAIAALQEVAGTQNRSTWGVKSPDQHGGGSGGEGGIVLTCRLVMMEWQQPAHAAHASAPQIFAKSLSISVKCQLSISVKCKPVYFIF